jgi:hypothetical protein
VIRTDGVSGCSLFVRTGKALKKTNINKKFVKKLILIILKIQI